MCGCHSVNVFLDIHYSRSKTDNRENLTRAKRGPLKSVIFGVYCEPELRGATAASQTRRASFFLQASCDEGEMLEWLKRHAWKACKLQKGFGGSNPPLSAKIF